MTYFFFSMSSRITKKNIGVCIVQAQSQNLATAKVLELNLKPDTADDVEVFELDDEGFREQGLELNKFYTREQVLAQQFETFDVQRSVADDHFDVLELTDEGNVKYGISDKENK